MLLLHSTKVEGTAPIDPPVKNDYENKYWRVTLHNFSRDLCASKSPGKEGLLRGITRDKRDVSKTHSRFVVSKFLIGG